MGEASAIAEPVTGSPWWDSIQVLHQLSVANFYDKRVWHQNDRDLDLAWEACTLHDIAPWPVDATVIHSDPYCVFVLGCLKSAVSIPETNQRIGTQVDIVISMNDEDSKHRGEPADYQAYYASVGVQCNLRYGGYDKQNIWYAEAEAKRAEYVFRWWQVATDLLERLRRMYKGEPVVILFHCFGGVNRSSSTLCALLIIMRRYTAHQAILALVSARPGLQYWARRQYFVEALYALECQVRCVGSTM